MLTIFTGLWVHDYDASAINVSTNCHIVCMVIMINCVLWAKLHQSTLVPYANYGHNVQFVVLIKIAADCKVLKFMFITLISICFAGFLKEYCVFPHLLLLLLNSIT